jgi:hypothetical protein
VYVFFPETNGVELEDIDHLFDKGGITGGVFSSKGGRTIRQRDDPYIGDSVAHSTGFEEKPGDIKEEEVAGTKVL